MKKILVLILTICLVGSLIACSKNNEQTANVTESLEDDEDKSDTEKAKSDNKESKSDSIQLEDPNVSIMIWYEPDEPWLETKRKFEEKYNANLEVVQTSWGEMENKLVASVAAGDSVDLAYLYGTFYPRIIIKNLFQPIDDYVDLNDPIWDKSKMDFFTWKGKHYGLCTNRNCDMSVLFYNKTMFENNGLEDPVELYERGEWNWDSFLETAIELTQDIDGDGAIDQWAYSSGNGPIHYQWIISNNVDLVTIEGNGLIKTNFDDPNLIETLQFMEDLNGKYKVFGKQDTENFVSGKLAMMEHGPWFADNLKEMKDEWDIVSFPYGPNNTEKLNPALYNSWGITNGAKNPKGAVEFAKCFLNPETLPENVTNKKRFNDVQLERLYKLYEKTIGLTSEAVAYDDTWSVYGAIGEGKPVSTFLAEKKPHFDTTIQDILSDEGIVINADPFDGMELIDFEEENLNEFTVTDNCRTVITSDQNEIIEGKSLKITVGEQATQELIKTKYEQIKLIPGHTYKITFDYKFLEELNENEKYFIKIKGIENEYKSVELENKTDTINHFEAEIPVYEKDKELSAVLISDNGANIIIDNFYIESVK